MNLKNRAWRKLDTKGHAMLFTWHFWSVQISRDGKRISYCLGLGGEQQGRATFLSEVIKMLKVASWGGVLDTPEMMFLNLLADETPQSNCSSNSPWRKKSSEIRLQRWGRKAPRGAPSPHDQRLLISLDSGLSLLPHKELWLKETICINPVLLLRHS